MKLLILLASTIDLFIFLFLMYLAYLSLQDEKLYEMCALICTAVFWQRAWKEDIWQKLKECENDNT